MALFPQTFIDDLRLQANIVQVVQEEATEDIQKAGAVEALDAPYFDVSVPEMVRKRGVWLVVLFIGAGAAGVRLVTVLRRVTQDAR